jgi:GntR family negative regulator for fad regulon and positive regulator of fabA
VKAACTIRFELVRRYGHDSGEIWHRMQKSLPGDLAMNMR